MQSILFIGADFEQYLNLKAIFSKFACVDSVSLPDGIRQFNQQQFCLLILDLSLIASDAGQEELLRSFRRAHPVPIIVLCDNTEDSNIVRLLKNMICFSFLRRIQSVYCRKGKSMKELGIRIKIFTAASQSPSIVCGRK